MSVGPSPTISVSPSTLIKRPASFHLLSLPATHLFCTSLYQIRLIPHYCHLVIQPIYTTACRVGDIRRILHVVTAHAANPRLHSQLLDHPTPSHAYSHATHSSPKSLITLTSSLLKQPETEPHDLLGHPLTRTSTPAHRHSILDCPPHASHLSGTVQYTNLDT